VAVGTDPAIIPTSVGYVQAICWGVPAMFATQALTYTSEGLGQTRPIMLMTLLALPVNVLLNWVFMFGHWGAPALGAVGAGVASAITMWIALGFMILLMRRPAFARYSSAHCSAPMSRSCARFSRSRCHSRDHCSPKGRSSSGRR
jgi:MATE family multidrug resistance protein